MGQDTTILPSRSSHSRWEAKLGTGDLSKGLALEKRPQTRRRERSPARALRRSCGVRTEMTLNREERAIPAGGTAGPRPRSGQLAGGK